MTPFRIEGPALISFSGGRTSAYMLRRILDEGLQPDVHVAFANTGKEREETLCFVRDCADRWKVNVRWLERVSSSDFVEKDFATADRVGAPFAELIEVRRMLPNPVMRFCTTELKIRVMKNFMLAQGYEEWTNVVGLRADEPARVARIRAPKPERWENAVPLFDAGITNADVLAFWKAQPFDLALQPWEGNCDLCFLKGRAKKERIVRDRPDLAEWWIVRERELGHTFRANGPTYEAMLAKAKSQLGMPFLDGDADVDDLGDCVCNA